MATNAELRAAKKFASTRAGSQINKLGRRLEGARAEFGTETGRIAKEFGTQMTEYEQKASAYESEFSDYKTKYTQALSAYEQQVNEFNSRVAAFNQKTLVGGSFFQGYSQTGPIGMYRSGIRTTDPIYQTLLEAGTSPVTTPVPAGFVREEVYSAGGDAGGSYARYVNPSTGEMLGEDAYNELVSMSQEVRGLGNEPTNPLYTLDVTEYTSYGYQYGLYRRGGTDPGEFNVSFNQPTVPTFNEPVPVMEDIAPYSQKLQEETTYFERELGERKLARSAAARRLQTRPLLSGA
jgi:hypothetical protein